MKERKKATYVHKSSHTSLNTHSLKNREGGNDHGKSNDGRDVMEHNMARSVEDFFFFVAFI